MLLAVDIGNTSTKIGFYGDEGLLTRHSFPTPLFSDPGKILSEIGDKPDPPVSCAIICSVVSGAADVWQQTLQQKSIDVIVAANDLDLGFEVDYEPRSSIGPDRLVNALAVIEKYDTPAIICSFGTATTIDVVNDRRVFLGGLIAPGMQTAARSLRSATSQLPEITIERPDRLIGNSTERSIRSGVVFGHVAMVEGLIVGIVREMGVKPLVVATGGFATLIAELSDAIDTIDPDLTLDGLRILHKRVARSKKEL